MGLYCEEKCRCGGLCKFTSEHGHRLNRWKHVCKICRDEWDVKFIYNGEFK